MKAATLTVLAMLSADPMVGIAAQPAEGDSDQQQMLVKLKIPSPLRPGPAGRLNADGAVPSDCDESKATAGSADHVGQGYTTWATPDNMATPCSVKA